MVKNYLITALRSLLKDKFFTFLNILGLAVGMAAFLLIMHYVVFERSYDRSHLHSDQLYRVTLDSYLNNSLGMSSAENYPGVGPALKAELPEVLDYARLYNLGYKNNVIITYEDAPNGPVKFKHRNFLYADSSLLPLFGYKMALGDPKTALSEPNKAVISASYAKKYFGKEEPLGKMLRLQDDDFNDELCEVTGVFEDIPENTHLKFDILFSYSTLYGRGDWAPERYGQTWRRKDMYTYVLLQQGTDAEALEKKLPEIVDKYSPGLAEQNRKDVLKLQAIGDIHLRSNLAEEAEANGDERIVNFLSIIAVFIMVIAWVNYINLSTAKAMERAGEVGIRKVMGAFPRQLVFQFLVESIVVNGAAMLLALAIIWATLPFFNQLTGLYFSFLSLFSWWFALTIFGTWLMGSLLSGAYPSFVLSSFRPAGILKGKIRHTGSGAWLRKTLVVLQFTASVALISGTLIVYQQLNYMMAQDIGMDIEQVLVVERPGVSARDRDLRHSNVDAFKNDLVQDPSILSVSGSLTIPGKKREYKTSMKRYGANDDEQVVLRMNSMDYDFLEVFKMDLLAGSQFQEGLANDTSIVLSKSAAELMGFKDPEQAIGRTLSIPGFEWNPIVMGVVNDYHQESLKKGKDPMVFYFNPYGAEFYSMKIQPDRLSSTLAHVEKCWERAFPGNPFGYFFLDDYFNRQYQNEKKFGSLFSTFSILAMIIGCLGLLGLSAFTAQQRTKEVGIRKVMGASIGRIFILLSTGFMKLIGLAIVVAVPLVYGIMSQWLSGFAYRTRIEIWIFVLAGSLVFLVALGTVSLQTFIAATINPVKSLRYE